MRGYLAKRLEISEIDDVVQDVLLRIHARDGRWDVKFPKRYLYQVVNSTLVDLYRRNRTRCAQYHCELSPDTHPRDEISPIRILQAREDMRAANAALDLLPPRTREILVAVRVEGQSLKRVAEHYGISTSAVEKHISRALDALSARIFDADDRTTTTSRSGFKPRRIHPAQAARLS